MPHAKSGDTVQVHYTGKLEDGTVFDSSADRDPLEFTLGEGRVIPGFERAVTGMQPGESKTTTIPPDQAYGPHRDDMVATIKRDQLPDHLDPSVGQQLSVRQESGRQFNVTITAVSEQSITIDANHRLAGKSLVFDLELVAVKG